MEQKKAMSLSLLNNKKQVNVYLFCEFMSVKSLKN